MVTATATLWYHFLNARIFHLISLKWFSIYIFSTGFSKYTHTICCSIVIVAATSFQHVKYMDKKKSSDFHGLEIIWKLKFNHLSLFFSLVISCFCHFSFSFRTLHHNRWRYFTEIFHSEIVSFLRFVFFFFFCFDARQNSLIDLMHILFSLLFR